jgi:hypothetical protein
MPKTTIPSENPGQTNFSKIKVGATFQAGGETYKKTSELTFEDVNRIEQYISPLFDRSINAAPKPQQTIDTSAKIVKEQPIEVEAAPKSKKARGKKAKVE